MLGAGHDDGWRPRDAGALDRVADLLLHFRVAFGALHPDDLAALCGLINGLPRCMRRRLVFFANDQPAASA